MAALPNPSLPPPLSLANKVVVITGSSSGIGLEAARIFASHLGAHVVLACRNLKKTQPICDALNATPSGRATLLPLDTSSPASIGAFAKSFAALNLGRLDVLVLNAGIMAPPYSTVPTLSPTIPAIESQFATNHAGHFLLTSLLFPSISSTPGARIVVVSSLVARRAAQIDYAVAVARAPANYSPRASYNASKLANLLFARGLQRRVAAARLNATVVPCHPGYCATNLFTNRAWSWTLPLERLLLQPLLAQTAADGAVALVRASVNASVGADDYFAPGGWWECAGEVGSKAAVPALVTDEAADELWAVSEEICGKFVVR